MDCDLGYVDPKDFAVAGAASRMRCVATAPSMLGNDKVHHDDFWAQLPRTFDGLRAIACLADDYKITFVLE